MSRLSLVFPHRICPVIICSTICGCSRSSTSCSLWRSFSLHWSLRTPLCLGFSFGKGRLQLFLQGFLTLTAAINYVNHASYMWCAACKTAIILIPSYNSQKKTAGWAQFMPGLQLRHHLPLLQLLPCVPRFKKKDSHICHVWTGPMHNRYCRHAVQSSRNFGSGVMAELLTVLEAGGRGPTYSG